MVVSNEKRSDDPGSESTAIEIMARTLWGEARGEGRIGMKAVANVILNRARNKRRWPDEVAAVCLQPWQFSCWNKNDPNRKKLLSVNPDDPQFAIALQIARQAYMGALTDNTHGADHYHEQSIKPRWANKAPVARIGRHIFYRLA